MRRAALIACLSVAAACGPGISYHPPVGSTGGGGDSNPDSGTGGSGQSDYKLIKACYGDTCQHGVDCSSAACNSVTGHCFEAFASCPNFPCQYGTDCPSASCNSTTGICNP